MKNEADAARKAIAQRKRLAEKKEAATAVMEQE